MKRLIALMLCCAILFVGCGKQNIQGSDPTTNTDPTSATQGDPGNDPTTATDPGTPGDAADLGDDNKSFGETIESLGAYDGYFEGESKAAVVEWVSGTKNAYKLEGTTLTFTAVSADSVYKISGTFRGNIVIDVGDEYKFDLELHGFSLVCNTTNPIMINSGAEVAIKAKKDTKNYVYDMRSAIDAADETLYSGAIYANVDLEIGGKGELVVVSENNNGIHSKDDLQVKNLTLLVACVDNALKGNDSVEVTGCSTTLIASGGDCIKTSNSDVSTKGNQRGTISVTGGVHTLYAACDGIDAAYNAVIDDSATVLNIYTDKYSNYSQEVTATESDVYYIRFTSNAYSYSVKYYNGENDYIWVNAEYHSKVSSGRTSYYYYSFPRKTEYSKMQFFIYSSDAQRGQENEYLVKSDYLTPNSSCDTFALTSRGSQLNYQWTNYTTQIQGGGFGGPGGFGGMGEGNSDKGDHSTKGIKAANEIVINAGTINIKSYDDAIHANNDGTLGNNAAPLGNVTVNGGVITVYSNDDGLHADGHLAINAGTVTVSNAYEGLEGATVSVSGGYVSVNSKDDGINATTTSGTAIAISGGTLYVYCTGDGIDSNSRTANVGIVFSGGKTVVISNSGMNSAIDSENGYTYTAGSVVAIMPSGGMSSESTKCSNFTSIGAYAKASLVKDNYLIVGIGEESVTIKMPLSISALIIVLGDNNPDMKADSSVDIALDSNGVCWGWVTNI